MLSCHEIEVHRIRPVSVSGMHCAWLAVLQNVLHAVKFSNVPVHHSKDICCFLHLFDNSLDIIPA
jgi:hypothetical protein